jgi:hypothetical protein
MRKLPDYISDLGHGATSHAVPLTQQDCTAYGFVLRADGAQLQAFVDDQLNRVAPEVVRFRALAFVLHGYLSSPRTAGIEDVGWYPKQEAAFLVPVIELRRRRLPKLKFWAPYMFVDQPRALTTDREVWGYRKALGELSVPADPADPTGFGVVTQVFPEFDPAQPARALRLLEVTGGSASPVDDRWGDVGAAWRDIDGQLAD